MCRSPRLCAILPHGEVQNIRGEGLGMTMLVYRPKAVAYPPIVAQAATGEVNKVTCRVRDRALEWGASTPVLAVRFPHRPS